MTTIIERLVDVGGEPLSQRVSFSIPRIRETSGGDVAVMVRHHRDLDEDGGLEVDLDPGPVVLHIPGHPPYRLTIPDDPDPVELWPLLEEGLVVDAAPAGQLEAIIDAWLSARVDDIRGDAGRGIDSIDIDDSELVFAMSSGPEERVEVPALSEAVDAATDAVAAKNAAETAASTAVTKAGEAAGSAEAADDAREESVQAADDAQASAGMATGAATAATAKAVEASASAASATNQAGLAGTARSDAEAARDLAAGARDAAAQSAADANQSALDAAAVVTDGVPNASASVKGGIKLAGDLGGTWDAPTVPGLADRATQTWVLGKIADLVDGSPELLDSFAELAAALGNDPNFAATIVTELAGKVGLDDARLTDARTPTTHQHAAGDILSGTLDIARIPTGTSGAQVAAGNHTHTKSAVGLGSVDNTADADKPVSTAVQSALDAKVPTSRTITAGTGLSGGGALSADRSLALSAGTLSSLALADTAVQPAALAAAQQVAVNAQSGATHTLVLADAARAVECTNGASITVTVPTNASVAFPVGTVIEVVQTGAGRVTVAGAGGVTLVSGASLSTRAQWSILTLRKRGTDSWIVAGDMQ